MKLLFLFMMTILLTACAGSRYASTYSNSPDRMRISTCQLDSIFTWLMQRDSAYVRDSIYMCEKGDTVTKYVEHVRYKYKVCTDTLYKYRILHDTMYIEKHNNICGVKRPYIKKPRRWQEKGLMWAGGLCCIFSIWALLLYLKRKFR